MMNEYSFVKPHHLRVPNVMKIWEPKPLGTLGATPGLLREDFTIAFPLRQWLQESALMLG